MSGEPRRGKNSPLKMVVAFSIVVLFIGVLVWYSPRFLSPKILSREELVNYALSLINSDRQSNGLQNVTLSGVDSGQRHADEMLMYHFLSHWDTNGFKPYMRYTLEGGKGAVSENCAQFYESGGLDASRALRELEHDMVYDDASSNWGHRDNILDAFHNKVSIGIAYDKQDLYFVEDFEDDYISWSTLHLSTEVRLQGTILSTGLSISQLEIYFDKPTSLTSQQLSSPAYQDGSEHGSYVGMVVSSPPSGYQYEQPGRGVTIIANTWNQTGQNFEITFDMSSAFAQCGKGVYTLYLWTDSDECLTSLSIWN
jgi:hypothetical protein